MLSGQASSQCERVRDPATRVPRRQADYRETHQRDHRRCSSCHKISLFAGEGDRAKGRFLFPENRGHTGTVFHVHAGRGYRQAGDSQSGPKRRERSYLSSFAGLFPASLAGARGLCEKRHRWRRLEKFGYFLKFLKNKSQSKRRTLARETPERSANSAWVMFKSSLRSLALFASPIWTS